MLAKLGARRLARPLRPGARGHDARRHGDRLRPARRPGDRRRCDATPSPTTSHLRLAANVLAGAIIGSAAWFGGSSAARSAILVPIAAAKLAEATSETCYGLAQRHDRMRFVADLADRSAARSDSARWCCVVTLGGTARRRGVGDGGGLDGVPAPRRPAGGAPARAAGRAAAAGRARRLARESAPLGAVNGVCALDAERPALPAPARATARRRSATSRRCRRSSRRSAQLAGAIGHAAAPRLGWAASDEPRGATARLVLAAARRGEAFVGVLVCSATGSSGGASSPSRTPRTTRPTGRRSSWCGRGRAPVGELGVLLRAGRRAPARRSSSRVQCLGLLVTRERRRRARSRASGSAVRRWRWPSAVRRAHGAASGVASCSGAGTAHEARRSRADEVSVDPRRHGARRRERHRARAAATLLGRRRCSRACARGPRRGDSSVARTDELRRRACSSRAGDATGSSASRSRRRPASLERAPAARRPTRSTSSSAAGSTRTRWRGSARASSWTASRSTSSCRSSAARRCAPRRRGSAAMRVISLHAVADGRTGRVVAPRLIDVVGRGSPAARSWRRCSRRDRAARLVAAWAGRSSTCQKRIGRVRPALPALQVPLDGGGRGGSCCALAASLRALRRLQLQAAGGRGPARHAARPVPARARASTSCRSSGTCCAAT